MMGFEFEDNLLEDRFGPENGYAIYDTGSYTVLHIYLFVAFEVKLFTNCIHIFQDAQFRLRSCIKTRRSI